MNLKNKIRKFIKDISGVSAVETAILFPILLMMMTAVYDLGQGVVISQKVNSASQVIGDILARYETVDSLLIDDVINAGELALAPYSTDEIGYDIISVEFDEDGDAFELWRRTFNMTAENDPLEDAVGLGSEGEGVIIVSVRYEYIPFFNKIIVNNFIMNERAFLKGRKSLTVPCTDCG